MLAPVRQLRPDGTHDVALRLRVDVLGPYVECPCCGGVGPARLAGRWCAWCAMFGHGKQRPEGSCS